MLKKKDVLGLRQKQGEALVSIIAPLEKIFPATDKNPIIVKNLIRETEKKLRENYDPVRVDALMKKINSLEDKIDYRNCPNGIALFVSEDTEQILTLPFVPHEKVSVGNSFETRDLLVGLDKNMSYLLLALSLEDVRLYRCAGDAMEEITNGFFPASYLGPSRTEALTHITRQDTDSEELEDVKIFLRTVDENLYDFVKNEKSPLFILAEAEYLSFLKSQDKSGRLLAGELAENPAHLQPKELLARVRPAVMQAHVRMLNQRVKELEESVGYNLYASGISDVWKATKLGQVKTVLIEETYNAHAREKANDELTLILNGAVGNGIANLHEDICDDIAEIVSNMDGEVLFVPDGMLTKHNRIAAILRYSV